MKEFSSVIDINAAPDVIWAIITDAATFPEWEPNITQIEGDIALGEEITIHTKLSPNRAFSVKVSELIPNEKITWSMGGRFNPLKGSRTFTLTPQDDGTTQVVTHEVFSGPLFALVSRAIPDLSESFEQFSAALKSRAEGS